ncbi:hypothetical protein JNUCC0626_36620 [Lentzea sp. JNUCC 0626]|uniref:hypothetical protein n=1 Tax=Lentzea sp. JNUCC 0626 TaxID=3367513 RepID=UPI00374A0964
MSDSEQPPVLDDLGELEQKMVDAARRGEWVGPAARISVSELEETDDPNFQVRAEVVRELLCGYRGKLDPRGVLVAGVRIVGRLDLNHITAVAGLALVDSALPDGMTGYNGRLRRIDLSGSFIAGIHADSVRIDGNLIMRGTTVHGKSASGALQMRGAHVAGDIDLDRAAVTNDDGPALVVERARIDQSLFLRDAYLSGAGDLGAFRILSAHVAGDLELDRSELVNSSGPCFAADGLRVDNRLLLEDVTAAGRSKRGAVRLLGAKIGRLSLNGANVDNSEGPALVAERIQVNGGLFLLAAKMAGVSEIGAVVLTAANIDVQLVAAHVAIRNSAGPALSADAMVVKGGMFLRDAVLTGVGGQGVFRLLTAHIAGSFELDRISLTNLTGPALSADGLRADRSMYLRGGEVRGEGSSGAIRLLDAKIDGQVNLKDSEFSNKSGPVLVLSSTTISGALFFPASLQCVQSSSDVRSKGCPADASKIVVHGLTYARLADVSWRQWLHLLAHHTLYYLPQPYQQLAAVERAAGHDTNARQVLITQQEDLRHRSPEALGGRLAKWRHGLWGWLGRYGYRAHRLVTALAIVLAVSGSLGYAAGQVSTRSGHHAAERVVPASVQSTSSGIPCSTAELIGLGIDRGLPVGATGLRARCDLDTATRRGQAFTFVLWLLQALVWALATLAVAAYTGLVRKPT